MTGFVTDNPQTGSWERNGEDVRGVKREPSGVVSGRGQVATVSPLLFEV